MARATKAKTHKWDLFKLENVCTSKPSTNQKGNLLDERRYLQKICPARYPKYIRNSYNSISKKKEVILLNYRQRTVCLSFSSSSPFSASFKGNI